MSVQVSVWNPWYNQCSQDPPLKRELSTRQCERFLIGMNPSHNWVAPKIFPGLYSYLGIFREFQALLTCPYGQSRLQLSAWALSILRWPYWPYLGYWGGTCRGYSAGVPARLGSDSTVTLRLEAECHNNWLRTSTYCVWESQASPRWDIPASFSISLIQPLFSYIWL